MLTIQELVNENEEKIPFSWVAGHNAGQRVVADPGAAGADLVGHLNLIHPSRIQVFGTQELSYYVRFDKRRRKHHLQDLVEGGVPAIVLADAVTPPKDLIEFCDRQNVPLLTTPLSAAQTIDLLRIYLGKRLAPKT